MKVSTKGRYALRVMVDLSLHRHESFVSLRDIAQRQDISLKYLEQIITPLMKADLLHSCRGNNGGYQLARPAAAYTAGEILRVMEGDLSPVPCLCEQRTCCPRRDDCATRGFWQGLAQAVNQYVDGVTLQDLAQQCLAQGAEDYCI